MWKQITITTLITITFAACRPKAAFNYSEAIVKKERSMIPDINLTESKVKTFTQEGKNDSVAAAGERMENIVQSKIDEIEAMPEPEAKGVTEFKAATVNYFRYIKSIYTQYKLIGRAATEEERDRSLKRLQEVVAERETVISDMRDAQKKYANANGLKVE